MPCSNRKKLLKSRMKTKNQYKPKTSIATQDDINCLIGPIVTLLSSLHSTISCIHATARAPGKDNLTFLLALIVGILRLLKQTNKIYAPLIKYRYCMKFSLSCSS